MPYLPGAYTWNERSGLIYRASGYGCTKHIYLHGFTSLHCLLDRQRKAFIPGFTSLAGQQTVSPFYSIILLCRGLPSRQLQPVIRAFQSCAFPGYPSSFPYSRKHSSVDSQRCALDLTLGFLGSAADCFPLICSRLPLVSEMMETHHPLPSRILSDLADPANTSSNF